MAAELIVDFPPTPKRHRDVVKFAETPQLNNTVDRHEDKNELWYTKAEQDMNMASELIVDFPLRHNHAHARFANETAEVYFVPRHDDKNTSELWYTDAEYNEMKRSIKRDVFQARASDWTSKEDRGSWIGIAHLLTPACALEAKACRRRCVRAVLAEQARQEHGCFRSENIALASLAKTRKAAVRARMLGSLHQNSI